MMAEKSRKVFLTAGARVEICPYQENKIYKFLGHMDGETGTVKEIDVEPNPYGPSQSCILVNLDSGLGAISFPDGALKVLDTS